MLLWYNVYVNSHRKEGIKIMAEKQETKKTEKVWAPNETQKAFLKTLENYPDGATLKDIELDTGVAFKSGAINVLKTKGLVETSDGERVSDKVYRGVVIGQITEPVKIYRLA